ncbi:MAG: 2-keto-4-pentenoate hydratase [Hyphomicrobiaceae bacterium]
MDPTRIAQAAALLVAARQQRSRIGPLPAACRPQSVADAHAIQDAVTAMLGAEVRAFKANAAAAASSARSPSTSSVDMPWMIPEGVRAPIYAPTIRVSPGSFPAAEMPQCGVEGEVAFRFHRDLPPRPTSYTRKEIAASIDACAAIEVVSSRFADPDAATFYDKLADCISNAGFVHSETSRDWHSLDFGKLKVTLTVNGETVLGQAGGHPTGDPLGIVVALVEMMRTAGGVTAGQFVTCGSYTGLRYLKRGDICGVSFDGLGVAEVGFAP